VVGLIPRRTLRVPVADELSLALDVWGGGPPGMLLVHGLASNARMWDGVADALVRLGHAVATVDLRGHGRSDKPASGYGIEAFVADLRVVLGELARHGEAWSRPVAVGQSFGANVVVELGFEAPELVRGVACVDGGTIELAARFATVEEALAALAPPQIAGMPAEAFERELRAAHPDWPECGIQGALANVEVRPDGTVAPWLSFEHHLEVLEGLYRHRPSSRFPAMRVPVLLLPAERPDGAEAGPALAVKRAAVARALQALPPGLGQARWFSPADHDVHAEHPEQVAEVLHDAVAGGFFG
jgi:pimeloyl-ACP methyl ester carboxylesterase